MLLSKKAHIVYLLSSNKYSSNFVPPLKILQSPHILCFLLNYMFMLLLQNSDVQRKLRNVIQVPQHFPLVYTHTLMDIVLSMAELNNYCQDLCLTHTLCLAQLYNCTIQLKASLCTLVLYKGGPEILGNLKLTPVHGSLRLTRVSW